MGRRFGMQDVPVPQHVVKDVFVVCFWAPIRADAEARRRKCLKSFTVARCGLLGC